MWEYPRRHPRHVPTLSLRASMPHDLYMATSQSFARLRSGEPVSRGPSESNIACASFSVRELSNSTVWILVRTGSIVVITWDWAVFAGDTAAADKARRIRRFIIGAGDT